MKSPSYTQCSTEHDAQLGDFLLGKIKLLDRWWYDTNNCLKIDDN